MTQYNLTPRQRDALTFIDAHVRRYGVAPSYREIASGLGIAGTSSVGRLVDGLVARGALRKCGRAQRSITLVHEIEHTVLPVQLAARLGRYCEQQGEPFDDVLSDAVELFLDARVRDCELQAALDQEAALVAGGGDA